MEATKQPRADEQEALEIANRAIKMMAVLSKRPVNPLERVSLKRLYNARGYYYPPTRTITLLREESEGNFPFDPRTMAHEIAHHFVYQLAGKGEPAHGKVFNRMYQTARSLLGCSKCF